ncbi:hypothetical protein FIU86_04380 [Roseovarius sp. THAF9]|uniref:hypothetical protein n=1 Tax=Roseovarius sp. THAF9 TaxID=2587847 RepID=UPI001267E928|nr:hypothetical protein [Roseovarius sp. THAF9]QFT92068.1 hypothetical protein FIU86_04380 [Roseovarius sp. THAF9]
MPRKTPEQKIESLEQQLRSARAEKKKQDRRARTRRLVLLGSGVERLIETAPEDARDIVPRIMRTLDERDQPAVAETLKRLHSALKKV